MPTLKQKQLAKAIVENVASESPKTAGELLESVGYSRNVAEAQPGRTIEQKGVKEELIAYGFHPEKAKEVVSEILIAGENDTVKLKAADMIFKTFGTYAAEKHVNLNLKVEDSEKVQEATKYLNDFYRGRSIGSDGEPSSALGTEAQD